MGQTVTLVNAIYQRVFEEWQLGNETVGDLFEMLVNNFIIIILILIIIIKL